MERLKNIFIKFVMLTMVLVMQVSPVFADNGCEDEDNDYIAPEFALCSIHAYNINSTSNPDATERELMRSVIAMKTEVITQQMFKHYQQMESMLKRFETQLKKAVLSANLKAAGAKSESSSSSSSYKQTNMNIFMEDAKDCSALGGRLEVANCFRDNYNLIYNISGSGTARPDVKWQRQLANDYKLVCNEIESKEKTCTESEADYKKCTTSGAGSLGNKTNFQACLNKHNSNLRKLSDEAREFEANLTNPWAKKKE